ncbi:MAG TPA: dipeptidase PepE [Pyrinomonadaceae bacterium]|nr:dipeptidase PepE [Pyrinomonadaceae bacterium]
MKTNRRLLLISNSTHFGRGYLDHVADEILDFLGSTQTVLFFPYALHDQDGYAAKGKARFNQMGIELTSIHQVPDPRQAIDHAQSIFVGGGNTFRLLNTLYELDLLETIKQRVSEGMLYLGASAGSNIAGPTIRTTNDMPIVEPPSFEALGLVSFQLNPHYIDADPQTTHMGETREERLMQFLEDNETPVLALREGSLLRIENERVLLKGFTNGRLFRKGCEPVEVAPGSEVVFG